MFQEIDVNKLQCRPIEMINEQWMLISAGTEARMNTMTASWGGLGELWSKPVAFIFIRPQRYTLEFVQDRNYFTMSFFSNKYRKALNYCGSHSGRDVDKAKETGLTPIMLGEGAAPAFEQAELVLLCRKLYEQPLAPGGFVDNSLISKNYPNQDFHRMFVGEIVKAYQQSDLL